MLVVVRCGEFGLGRECGLVQGARFGSGRVWLGLGRVRDSDQGVRTPNQGVLVLWAWFCLKNSAALRKLRNIDKPSGVMMDSG